MTFYHFAKQSPITALLLSLIVAIFVVMVMMGVHIESPSSDDLLSFGATFLPLTVNEPLRLISSGFIHIGFMHLLFNGFALYFFGSVCEQCFDKSQYLALFLLSVIGGNLSSLFWELQTATISVSAGASGGIMGLGAALVILSFSRHRLAQFINKKGLLITMGINLILGFTIPNINNAAHIGGAIVGGLLSAVFLYIYPKSTLSKNAVVIGISMLMLYGFFWFIQFIYFDGQI